MSIVSESQMPPPTPRLIPLPAANALALMLAALAMLGPFSIDTYLPAFANIEATLHATTN